MAGFAGAVADALTLFAKFEAQLKSADGNLRTGRPSSWPRSGAPTATCAGWKRS